MNKKIVSIMVIVILSVMFLLPFVGIEVGGFDNSIIYGESHCGSISSTYFGITTYPDSFINATKGIADSGNSLSKSSLITIGEFEVGNSAYYQGFLSFNTITIPSTDKIISAECFMNCVSFGGTDISVNGYSIDYGDTLTISDWGISGTSIGEVFNTSTTSKGNWVDFDLPIDSVSKVGSSQYKFNSSSDKARVPFGQTSLISFSGFGSSTPPYLIIQTITETEVILTYNFTQNNPVPEIMNVTYMKKHNDQSNLNESWENCSFLYNDWYTVGSPTIQNWTVYEGDCSAGGIVNISGTGTHSFEISRSTSQHKWVNIDYARMTDDVGQGTPIFQLDWWDGNHWYQIEYLSGTNAWGRNSANLSGLGGDNNANFKLRFSIEFLAPSNNGNAIWVDNIYINSTPLVNASKYEVYIHPVEIIDYNTTHEVLRYEFLTSYLLESVNLTVNSSLVYSTINPYWPMATGVSEGKNYYNISMWLHRFEDLYTHIWFYKSKLDTSIYIEQMNTYPVEIIDWGAKDLVRYEFESLNATWLRFESPNTSFTHLSISPDATIIQYNSTTWNITELYENTHYKIWFTINKTTYCTAFVSLYREATGEGIPFGTWDNFINMGSTTNTTIMEPINNPEITLEIGTTYTISVFDYFPTPNFITNHTFIAIDTKMDIDIPVPYGALNFKSYRYDVSAIRIWYDANTSNTPYSNHVPGGEWLQLYIRGGDFMIAISYLTTTENGTSSIDNTYFHNISINSSLAYTIEIGTDIIEIIQTTTSGLSITLDTVETWVTPGLISIYANLPIFPIDGTRGNPAQDNQILIHPFMIIEADAVNLFNEITTANLWDPRPSSGSVDITHDYLTIQAEYYTRIFLNYTNGTNFINYTTVPSSVNLVDLTVSNFTYWSNSTSSIERKTTIRITDLFYWIYEPNIVHYFTTQTINNTTPFDWYDVYWRLAFIEDTVPRDITIYDNDNKIFLTADEHYETTSSSIRLRWDRFNSSLSRTFTFSYYNTTDYDFDEPVIRVHEYTIEDYNTDPYWKGSGTWDNSYSAPYNGRAWIVLSNLDGIIDPDSVIVKDENGDVVPTGDRPVAGNSIIISSSYVGTIPVDGELTYDIYFQYYAMDPAGVPALYEMWYYWVIMVIFGLVMLIGFIYEEDKAKRLWLVFWTLIIFIWGIVGIMSWYLHLG